jgi:hypothetical protein
LLLSAHCRNGAVLLAVTQQRRHLGAAEQGQQALELASMGGGGVELEDKSASIKSISDSIQSSNASSLSSSSSFRSSSLSRVSLSGSRSQLSIDKNERKRDSHEPYAPLLLHGDEAPEEVDVVIGGEQRNKSNDNTSDGLEHGWRIDREATRPGPHWGIERQFRSPNQQPLMLVLMYWRRQVGWRGLPLALPGSALPSAYQTDQAVVRSWATVAHSAPAPRP